jgi:tRNA U38,U39,U40 pseudouridine synthase TruA
MKKQISILFFLLSLLFSAQLQAQVDADRYTKSTIEPAVRAKKKADKILQIIDAKPDIATKIYDLYLVRIRKTDDIKGSAISNEDKDKALKLNKDDFESKLKTLIGDADFTKFKAAKDEDSKKEN